MENCNAEGGGNSQYAPLPKASASQAKWKDLGQGGELKVEKTIHS
jgi:hypothetical protein